MSKRDKELGQEYSEKIREIRKKGLTQLEVARILETSTNTIRSWEYNLSTPHKSNRESIDELYQYVVVEERIVTKKQRIRVGRADDDVEMWE